MLHEDLCLHPPGVEIRFEPLDRDGILVVGEKRLGLRSVEADVMIQRSVVISINHPLSQKDLAQGFGMPACIL